MLGSFGVGRLGPIGKILRLGRCEADLGCDVACFHPMPAVRLPNGAISMLSRDASGGVPLSLPCGSCDGCRMDRVKSWALRNEFESQVWSSSYFLTLTYDDEHLPPLAQLQPRDLQLFLKRVRQEFVGRDEAPDGRRPIRFFACGEYGEQTQRPHYHVLLYNVLLTDVVPYGTTEYVESPTMTRLWGHGKCLIGEVEPASCAYVSGYALKKIRRVERNVELVDPATGECVIYQPPFSRMSRRPGIGSYWYDVFRGDLRRGYVQRGDAKLPIPRFFRERLQRDHPEWCESQEFQSQERAVASLRENPDDFEYRRSTVGRETAEERNAIRRRLLRRAKQL